MTEQRTIILAALKCCSHHPAADEIYLRVKERLPRISLATVYRNLELMSASGMISKLEYGSSQSRFDPNPVAHSHFRCLRCGSVADLPFVIEAPALSEAHPWVKSRKILTGRVEYQGFCPDCRDQA
jgi:Fur family ferric uptake transcriptional regulator